MKVFDTTNQTHHTKRRMFLDGGMAAQRYDVQKYKQFDKLTETQVGFFWTPQEIDLTADVKDFRALSDSDKHIFTSNLKRQILLDSVQGRSPNLTFLPIVSIPEMETWIETWAFFETIHSRSYTHIIRNVYPNPSEVFDEMMDIEAIAHCANSISENYDRLYEMAAWYNLLGPGTHTVNGKTVVVDLYELKKQLWLTLMSVNILEGVRFYVSFACSWAFGEIKKMEGNAKIIKLIARDENIHLAFTQQVLKLLPNDDPDFAKISAECFDQCIKMYVDAVNQERDWADYLFKDGSLIGLNAELLKSYVNWLANRRMTAVGLPPQFQAPTSNPLPWTQRWIAGSEVQDAPQEVAITNYILGGVKQDLTADTMDSLLHLFNHGVSK